MSNATPMLADGSPNASPCPPMVVLAAGQGARLRPLTDHQPKCMVPLAGRCLIDWHLDAARMAGVDQLHVVAGYQAHALQRHLSIETGSLEGDASSDATPRPIPVWFNQRFASTNMVCSLVLALAALDEQGVWQGDENDALIVGYGDIVYEPSVLAALLANEAEVAVVVDRDWRAYWEKRGDDDLSDTESLVADEQGRIWSIGQPVVHAEGVMGQYIGLMQFRGRGLLHMRRLLAAAAEKPSVHQLCPGRGLDGLYMTDLLQALINHGQRVDAVWADGKWLEVDTPSDLALAESMVEADGKQLVIRR